MMSNYLKNKINEMVKINLKYECRKCKKSLKIRWVMFCTSVLIE